MRISSKTNPRKLIAVIDPHSDGIFFRNEHDKAVYININGIAISVNKSLEKILDESINNKGIYEGDSITIQA